MSSVDPHVTSPLSLPDVIRFHACLEARERLRALIRIGHFASDRPAMLQLAGQIGCRYPLLDVWTSATETDSLQRV